MSTPTFETRDPARADFWTERYASDFMPWDQRAVPEEFARAVRGEVDADHLPKAPARVLIPGCGSSYELQSLADAGYDALAIDISSAAVERAREQVGTHQARVRLADCFVIDTDAAHAARYDWVYERAFVCALPTRLWSRWAQAMAALVAPGGVLAGYFYFDPVAGAQPMPARRGPPFAMLPEELAGLLGSAFECVVDRPVPPDASVPVFRGKERWMVWRRR